MFDLITYCTPKLDKRTRTVVALKSLGDKVDVKADLLARIVEKHISPSCNYYSGHRWARVKDK